MVSGEGREQRMDGEKTGAITERGRESRTKGEEEKDQGVAFVEQRTLIRVCAAAEPGRHWGRAVRLHYSWKPFNI